METRTDTRNKMGNQIQAKLNLVGNGAARPTPLKLRAQRIMQGAKNSLHGSWESVESTVKEKPLQAVLVGITIGLVAGIGATAFLKSRGHSKGA